MPAHSEKQREKAVKVLTDLLASYGDTQPALVARFGNALERELESQPRLDVFGVYGTPDGIVRSAIRKAKLPDNAIIEVIRISFERDDKIGVFLDGKWSLR